MSKKKYSSRITLCWYLNQQTQRQTSDNHWQTRGKLDHINFKEGNKYEVNITRIESLSVCVGDQSNTPPDPQMQQSE